MFIFIGDMVFNSDNIGYAEWRQVGENRALKVYFRDAIYEQGVTPSTSLKEPAGEQLILGLKQADQSKPGQETEDWKENRASARRV